MGLRVAQGEDGATLEPSSSGREQELLTAEQELEEKKHSITGVQEELGQFGSREITWKACVGASSPSLLLSHVRYPRLWDYRWQRPQASVPEILPGKNARWVARGCSRINFLL